MKQREIKFRAWDKKEKRMLKVVSMSSGCSKGVWGWFIVGEYEGVCIGSRQINRKKYDEYSVIQNKYGIKDIILMQYTGLKDQKGVEIYEGDIIKYSMDKDYINPVVFWDGSSGFRTPGFGIDTGNKYGHSLSINTIEVCDVEVIGNIYENKELLNNK